MKGFFIEVTNNLLEPKHRKAMGTAVWEFMWCLDKITKIDEGGVGWVLGGKAITREDIKKEIGINVSHISENLNKLQSAGYLVLTRTPHGMKIGVNKAQKRYSQKSKSEVQKGNIRSPKRQHQKSKKATSIYIDIDKTVRQDSKTVSEQSSQIQELIKLFEEINPACRSYYGNTTQRNACEFLIETFGFERVQGVIEKVLPKTNKLMYAPTITTPVHLKERWATLESFVEKEVRNPKTQGKGIA